MLRVACILQRNPVVMAPVGAFEAAYRALREETMGARSRGTFDILTAHKRELAKFGARDGASPAESSGEAAVAVPDHAPAYAHFTAQTDIRRRLERKLYFAVQDERGRWLFPWRPVQVPQPGVLRPPAAERPWSLPETRPPGPALHGAAADVARGLLGEAWEAWCASRVPVAVHSDGAPTFFFPVHVVAGALVFAPSAAFVRYAWCTREELGDMLDSAYYSSVRRVLSE